MSAGRNQTSNSGYPKANAVANSPMGQRDSAIGELGAEARVAYLSPAHSGAAS